MGGLKFPIRSTDVLLVVASCAIILVAALTSLFEKGEPAGYIKRDCELFYEHAGPGAVQNCIAETRAGRNNLSRP